MNVLLSHQLREQRARLIEQERYIIDACKKESRNFTPDEKDKLDRMAPDIRRLEREIELAERDERDILARATTTPNLEDTYNKQSQWSPRKRAFDAYLRHGVAGLSPEDRTELEFRAQSVGTATGGGYLVPEGFSNQLGISMKAFGGMRQIADVFDTATGNDMPWPTCDDTSNTGELLAENSAAAEQDVTFGQIVFKAYMYSSKLVKVSQQLLQDSAFDLQGELARIFGERIGRATNTHFTTGDNASKPQGVATAATTGVTAASTTAITSDEMISLFHSIDPAYRVGPKVAWMFCDSTLQLIRKLKDGNGAYLWQPGLQAGQPDLILGKPYVINQDVATVATGNKSVLFGDFSKYKIRDVKDFTVLRLNERYADSLQVGFLAFSRHDGRVLDSGTDPIKCILQP